MKILQAATRAAAAIAIAAGCTLGAAAYAAGAEIKTINVAQVQAMKNQGALLLDVREPHEFAEVHAPGSMLIPLGQLANRLNEIRSFENKPVVVICRSGRRSEQATGVLMQLGFKAVYNVAGGMLAWEKAALPVVKR